MPKLIDIDSLVLEYNGLAYIGPYDFAEIAQYFVDQIKAAPAVDAVPVVRCGKCVFRKYTENAYKVFGWNCTNKHSPCRGRIVGDADFCPYGERDKDEF